MLRYVREASFATLLEILIRQRRVSVLRLYAGEGSFTLRFKTHQLMIVELYNAIE